MRGFIELNVKFPQSHHMQKVVMVNVRQIISVGDGPDGAIVTTKVSCIMVNESYKEVLRLMHDALY